MKIALTCMDIQWENPSVNQDKCVKLIKRASDSGARLILFPEMTLTGFTMNTKAFAEQMDVPGLTETQQFFAQLSDRYHIAIGFGFIGNKEDEKRAENHFSVVDKGDLLGDYVKIHPFTYGEENQFYVGGDKLVSVTIDDVKIALFICYDLRFPEIFQKSSEKCSVLAVIANWPESREHHWKCLLQARAIENQAYVIGVNRKGLGDGLIYSKSSMVFDFDGKSLDTVQIQNDASDDDLLLCEIDSNEVLKRREEFPVKNDRKNNLYNKLDIE